MMKVKRCRYCNSKRIVNVISSKNSIEPNRQYQINEDEDYEKTEHGFVDNQLECDHHFDQIDCGFCYKCKTYQNRF